MFILDLASTLDTFPLGTCSQIVANGHTETIGHKIRCAQDNHHATGKAGTRDPGYDGERRNDSVNSSVNKVPEITFWRAGCQSILNGGGSMRHLQVGDTRIVHQSSPRRTA